MGFTQMAIEYHELLDKLLSTEPVPSTESKVPSLVEGFRTKPERSRRTKNREDNLYGNLQEVGEENLLSGDKQSTTMCTALPPDAL